MSNHPDILIVGAGMAGLALATALSDTPLRVLVVDPNTPPDSSTWPPAFDHRVSAITPASSHILQNLGVWESLIEKRVAAFQDMIVWDREGTGKIQFHCHDVGREALGHIVENRLIVQALFQKIQASANIDYQAVGLDRILEAESGEAVELDSDGPSVGTGWKAVLSDGQEIRPGLLVGADGAQSRVRNQLGFRCRTWAYGQHAVVATVKTERPHDNTARQVFLESGPLAFLPLRMESQEQQSRYSSIVWSLNEAELESVLALNDEAFCRRLGQVFEQTLGRVIEVDQRQVFPLVQNHAVHYILPGAVLIGDAAHTIHPLAGQGINLGFLDAATLAEEILKDTGKGLACSEFAILRRYQRRRKPHNLMMMSLMEGFNRLFQLDVPPLRIARNAGMSLLDGHFLIKNHIISHAMGLEGDLPELARVELEVDF